MNPSKDFEQINFNTFNFFNDKDRQDMSDPDLNYFNDLNSNNFDSPYLLEENVKSYLCDIKKYDNLSLIHVNIRGMNSNFEKFHGLLLNCWNSFNITCVTETLTLTRISVYQTLILYTKKEKLAKKGATF